MGRKEGNSNDGWDDALTRIHGTNVFERSREPVVQPFRSRLDWKTVLRATLVHRLACPGWRPVELYRAVAKRVPPLRELTPVEYVSGVELRVNRLLRVGPPQDDESGWDRDDVALLIRVLARRHPDRAAVLCARHPEAARRAPVDVLAAVREWALREPEALERLLGSPYFEVLESEGAADALGPRVIARGLASETPWVRERAYALLPFLSGRQDGISAST